MPTIAYGTGEELGEEYPSPIKIGLPYQQNSEVLWRILALLEQINKRLESLEGK